MTKKETTKFIVQIIVSIASAILTALGATSCMGFYKRSLWFYNRRDSTIHHFFLITPNSTLYFPT